MKAITITLFCALTCITINANAQTRMVILGLEGNLLGYIDGNEIIHASGMPLGQFTNNNYIKKGRETIGLINNDEVLEFSYQGTGMRTPPRAHRTMRFTSDWKLFDTASGKNPFRLVHQNGVVHLVTTKDFGHTKIEENTIIMTFKKHASNDRYEMKKIIAIVAFFMNDLGPRSRGNQ